MEQLLEVVGDNEDHDLADLLDITSTLIEQYEARNQPAPPPVEPSEILKYLMAEHGLKQTDLKKEIGSQGVVSEILAGKRQINVRQAKELAKRFRVSTAVFV